MGKKAQTQKEIPPRKNAEGSSRTAKPLVPLSQVVDLLKLANPGVDWGMAMAAMALAAQNPPVTTIPPTVTVPTPTVTSPIPITENPNQPSNRAVEPEIPEPSSPEKIESPQTVLDVSPVSVYEPPTAETKIDELEGGERDEGEEEGGKRDEGKGEGVKKTDLEKEKKRRRGRKWRKRLRMKSLKRRN